MHLVAQGLSNKDVARHLHVSEGTVKLHLHHIFCKTGVRRRARSRYWRIAISR
jgi:DNA-binding NarL/FixJ family response regulator